MTLLIIILINMLQIIFFKINQINFNLLNLIKPKDKIFYTFNYITHLLYLILIFMIFYSFLKILKFLNINFSSKLKIILYFIFINN